MIVQVLELCDQLGIICDRLVFGDLGSGRRGKHRLGSGFVDLWEVQFPGRAEGDLAPLGGLEALLGAGLTGAAQDTGNDLDAAETRGG
jgi:hypothetical protein